VSSLPFDIVVAMSFCGDAVFAIYLRFDTVVVLSFCFEVEVALSWWNCFTTTSLQALCQMIVFVLVVNI
jgi:putative cofactor-binding repeat protein